MPASNIITLDNLSEQLPPWRSDDENHLYAIVDMGSNGIRFSITSLAPPTTRLLLPVYSARAAISLFDALTPSSSGLVFSPSTIESVSSALSKFHQLAIMHGVPPAHIMILATEAMRRAANAAQILEAIGQATGGLGVQILDPSVETLFGAVMGSRSSLVDVKGGALFLDLGGGSVQMTWVDTSSDRYEINAAMAGESLPYGAAKLTRVLEEQPAEVQQMETGNLRDGIQRIYANLCSKFPKLHAIMAAHERGEAAAVDVYMCGGGFRGYGSMLMHNDDAINPYPISSISTYSVPGRLFRQTDEMRRVNQEYDGKIFGLSKRRRQQFPAITTVVEAFIAAVPNIGRVTFCGGSNRQGALMMKLPLEVRESNPLAVVANVTQQEKPIFDDILGLLSTALPKEMNSNIPTIFNLGLGAVFVRQIWHRQGYDADTNASFALHDAITRNSDCPGLTHLARAILGLAVCARWGCGLGPAEAELNRGLRHIADSHAEGSSFWAMYIGALSGAIATIFPIMPKEPHHIPRAVRLDTQITTGKMGKKDKVVLTIGLASEFANTVNAENLVDDFQATMSNKKDKSSWKALVQVTTLS
ncbi:Retrograde regulation protein 2 [Tolypocladium paradoxum]|uniref:Retrograde regulation protein 2 n=1 Tax=Tolypocladium paradoxum TaxID=94208 RepID=A0A2S4KNP6_9HYPO|nr:Retrograde regulation protein 2 [Tolypocladium paradoxum]